MLKNKTRNKTLSKKIKIADNPLSWSRGLMFTKKNENQALIFDFKKPFIDIVHMFFVFYSIDILFLDENKKIIDLKHNLKPFQIYKMKNHAHYMLEIPSGKITEKTANIGDALHWKEH